MPQRCSFSGCASPRSFAQRVPETYGDPLSLDEAIDLDLDLIDEVELPDRDEFAALLEVHTMTDLREIARRRGVRGGGRNKVELAAALAVSLADPANIDAALATLADDERAMLLALYLIDLEPNSWNAMGSAYRTISGETDPMKFTRALDTLVRLGLAFPSGEPNRDVDRSYHPPGRGHAHFSDRLTAVAPRPGRRTDGWSATACGPIRTYSERGFAGRGA